MSKFIPEYTYLKPIARGSHSDVDLYQNRAENRVAIKTISYLTCGQKIYEHIFRELKYILKLNHPRIIHIFQCIHNERLQKLHIAMEYAQNGTLNEEIQRRRNAGYAYIKQTDILRYVRQIVTAVQYLRDHEIIHSDLKPENMLLDCDYNIKLCDFSIAQFGHKRYGNEGFGTPLYMAPEVFESHCHDIISEVWSIGVITYEICTLKHPFQPVKLYDELFEKIIHLDFEPLNLKIVPMPYGLESLCYQMLKVKRHERIQLDQILQAECFMNFPLIAFFERYC